MYRMKKMYCCTDALLQNEVEKLTNAHRKQNEESCFLQEKLAYIESQNARKLIEMGNDLRLLNSEKMVCSWAQ